MHGGIWPCKWVVYSNCGSEFPPNPKESSEVTFVGAGVRPPPRGGPGNHPGEFRCSVGVCDGALPACDIVWYGVSPVLSVLLSRFVSDKRVGEASEQPFRSPSYLVLIQCLFLRFGGGSHGGETLASLGTMVPQDDSPKGGAAHGPATPRAFDSSVC